MMFANTSYPVRDPESLPYGEIDTFATDFLRRLDGLHVWKPGSYYIVDQANYSSSLRVHNPISHFYAKGLLAGCKGSEHANYTGWLPLYENDLREHVYLYLRFHCGGELIRMTTGTYDSYSVALPISKIVKEMLEKMSFCLKMGLEPFIACEKLEGHDITGLEQVTPRLIFDGPELVGISQEHEDATFVPECDRHLHGYGGTYRVGTLF